MNEFLDLSRYFYSDDWQSLGVPFTPLDMEIGNLLEELDLQGGPMVPFVAALVSNAAKEGHVCLTIDRIVERLNRMGEKPVAVPDALKSMREAMREAMRAYSAHDLKRALENHLGVANAPSDAMAFKPLVLEQGRVYLWRYWAGEETIARFIKKQAAIWQPKVSGKTPAEASPSQQAAIQKAVSCPFFVLTGGPGTGKTWTVLHILAAVQEKHAQEKKPFLKITLAAPTGKAAARLKEAIIAGKNQRLKDAATTSHAKDIIASIPEETFTLHRLLGASRDGSIFKHHENNPLQTDWLVIDEASMVDLGLMAKTMAALPPHARLMLVGDEDQLASVEAGSVLADLCFHEAPYVAELKENRRAKQQSLLDLAKVLKKPPQDAVSFFEQHACWHRDADWQKKLFEKASDGYRRYFETVDALCKRGTLDDSAIHGLFQQFNAFQILCPHREELTGVTRLNMRIENARLQALKSNEAWYPGRAVLITRNHDGLGLFNGDIGLALPAGGSMRVYFETTRGLKHFSPTRLPPSEPAFALTVHKSQGSEFDEVVLALPEEDLPLITKELLYTALTRTKESFSLYGPKKVLQEGMKRHIDRASGLREKLQPERA